MATVRPPDRVPRQGVFFYSCLAWFFEEHMPRVPEDEIPAILTNDYVRDTNLGISCRIRQRMLAGAGSAAAAGRTHLR